MFYMLLEGGDVVLVPTLLVAESVAQLLAAGLVVLQSASHLLQLQTLLAQFVVQLLEHMSPFS
jgi:hypothetical protein